VAETGRSHTRRRILGLAGAALVTTALALVIWLDISTGIWEDVAILSGIVAGLLTFLLTALFLDRILTRSEHERWLPVTHLALTDLLHGLAHEDSPTHRGHFSPRYLASPSAGQTVSCEQLEGLLVQVRTERAELSVVLARWSAFLAASADVQPFMSHVAEITAELDGVRDAVLDLERQSDDATAARLDSTIERYNARIAAAVEELRSLLDGTAPR
jgi:hypothetical protein